MPLARYKDLCIDGPASEQLGRFWAAALGLTFKPDEAAGVLEGETPEHRIWMNVVPEHKTVKNRAHLDVHADSVESLVALGASVLESAEDFGRPWTVMTDPDGGEFCAFVRTPDRLPAYRLYELVIDCADPVATAAFWAEVFGCEVDHADSHERTISAIPGMPFDNWTFGAVPEAKTVKNRVHWDVWADSVDDLVEAGATMLRPPTGGDEWHVLADPEGNEFCAFTPHR